MRLYPQDDTSIPDPKSQTPKKIIPRQGKTVLESTYETHPKT